MLTALRSLIALSLIGGTALFLCPRGGAKRVLKILVTAVLVSAVLAPLQTMDFDLLTLEEAKLSSAEARLMQESRQRENSLKKQFFLQNCERYITTRAENLGLRIKNMGIELVDAGEALWKPYAIRLELSGSPEAMEQLSRMMRDDLGIPAERQVWSVDE